MTVLAVVVFAAIAAIDAPRLIAERLWKDLAVYAFFFLAALALALCMIYQVQIPSLIKGMEYLFRNVLGVYYR